MTIEEDMEISSPPPLSLSLSGDDDNDEHNRSNSILISSNDDDDDGGGSNVPINKDNSNGHDNSVTSFIINGDKDNNNNNKVAADYQTMDEEKEKDYYSQIMDENIILNQNEHLNEYNSNGHNNSNNLMMNGSEFVDSIQEQEEQIMEHDEGEVNLQDTQLIDIVAAVDNVENNNNIHDEKQIVDEAVLELLGEDTCSNENNLSMEDISLHDSGDHDNMKVMDDDKHEKISPTIAFVPTDDDTTTNNNVQYDDTSNNNNKEQQKEEQSSKEQSSTSLETTTITTTPTLEEQIAILTKERDAAEQVSKELLERLSNNNNAANKEVSDEQSILSELQISLQTQMTRRAECEHQMKTMEKKLASYEGKMKEYSDMEDKIELLETNLTQMMASKTNLEQEVSSLRSWREEYEHNTAILSNRLNEAKKKEATKATTAERLEADNIELKDEITSLQSQLRDTTKAKEKLETSMEKLKKKCVDRIQMSEAALVEERNLNEERKKKMKIFVESKAEELRDAKNTNDEIKLDLNKTSEALNHVRTKLHHMTEMYESTSNKNRELIREITRIKKNTEQLHNLGSNLELELHKSAQETEEHKQKRNTAKHELMTMLRKLEAEQAISEKLRESIKFTFTPKALSQQQLLRESLEDLETELLKLSRRLGKPLPPKIGTHEVENESDVMTDDTDVNDDVKGKRNGKVNSRSEWDTARLLSGLEHETQLVSRSIMSFSSAVERLHLLLDDSGEKTCVSTLSEIFGAIAAGSSNTSNVSKIGKMTSLNGDLTNAVAHQYSDEDDTFTGSPVKRRNDQYGLVQQRE